MRTSRCYFLIFIFLCGSILIPGSCEAHHRCKGNHVALFIFGDSLFDSGNNNYLKVTVGLANFSPYGKTFFKYPTGRFTDGRVVPDILAAYLKLPLIPPYLQPGNQQFRFGSNFASAGSGVLDETYPGLVVNLKTQLSYFKNVVKQLRHELGTAETEKLLSRSLYMFSTGSNDYVAPFLTNSTVFQTYSKEEYVGIVVRNLTSVIKEVYEIGGRKFGVQNVLALGCTPLFRALDQGSNVSCLETESTILAKLHNRALSQGLKELHANLQGFKYSEFDFYTSLNERINNPSKYGFKEVKIACCSAELNGVIARCATVKDYVLCNNTSEYLFFDFGHPNEKGYKQFAKLMWSGTPNTTGPYNLKSLLKA